MKALLLHTSWYRLQKHTTHTNATALHGDERAWYNFRMFLANEGRDCFYICLKHGKSTSAITMTKASFMSDLLLTNGILSYMF